MFISQYILPVMLSQSFSLYVSTAYVKIVFSILFVSLESKFDMSQTRTTFLQDMLCYSSYGSITANFTIRAFFSPLCKFDFADHFHFSKVGKSHCFLSKNLQILMRLNKTLKSLQTDSLKDVKVTISHDSFPVNISHF